MIPLSDLTDIEIAFGFGVVTSEPEPVLPETFVFGMVPFSHTMYGDKVRIQRCFRTSRAGKTVVEYLPPEAEIDASVQSNRDTRIDPTSGRLTIVTTHDVRTPHNTMTKPDDLFLWTDHSGVSHKLVVAGGSIPRGIGDVEFSADCFEVV